MNIGDKVRIKSIEELKKIANLKDLNKPKRLKSGLMFSASMYGYAGLSGNITDISNPKKCKTLKERVYKIGELNIYWTKNMLERVE